MSRENMSNNRVHHIFDDLDSYRNFCRSYGYRYDEADLYNTIASRYPGRDIEITVSEDGENGATIRYNTTKPNLNVVI